MVPKLCAHVLVTFTLIVTGHWILAISNLPVTLWLANELRSVPSGNLGVYDPMEIHNRGQLKVFMRNVLIQVGFYLIIFFFYLYCMILACLKGNPIERSDEIIT